MGSIEALNFLMHKYLKAEFSHKYLKDYTIGFIIHGKVNCYYEKLITTSLVPHEKYYTALLYAAITNLGHINKLRMLRILHNIAWGVWLEPVTHLAIRHVLD